MKMSDDELMSIVLTADNDALSYSRELKEINDVCMDFYNAAPWNEIEGHSTVISTDVHDVVEADMPSLVEIFLGNKKALTFEPVTGADADIKEAEDKTEYVRWIVEHQEDYFSLIHNWIKTAEIKKFGVLRYDWTEEKNVTKRCYTGLDDAEYYQLLIELDREDKRNDSSVYVTKNIKEDDGWTLEAKIKSIVKKVKICAIPTDNFVISRNATSKWDAEIVGDDTLVSRSDLIAAGFDRTIVESLNVSSQSRQNSNKTGYIGGSRSKQSDVPDTASELVLVSTRCIKLDADGDGIAERLKVIYSGATLLSRECFDHVNYAILSTVLMPNEAIGKSRSEVNTKTQEVKTALVRGMLDNTYRVNAGRVVVNINDTNIDDVLTQRQSGIIRTRGDVRQAVAALETPYVADKTLQVIQYMDFARAQRSGTLMATQGLNADTFTNETATRFNGVQDEGAAKIRLVARVIAETGMKDLYEGICWTVEHYQDHDAEIMVLGKPMTVDPTRWRYKNRITSNVGIATTDEADNVKNMAALLQIHQQLKAMGSILTDDLKIYNTLDKLLSGIGIRGTNKHFNNPEIPKETLLAQYEQVLTMAEQQKLMIEQMQQKNPLAEAEQIKAQASLLNTQIKEEGIKNKNEIEIAKLLQDQNQFNRQLQEDQRQFNAGILAKLNELELKFNVNLVSDLPRVE
jgi:hypothetical protein